MPNVSPCPFERDSITIESNGDILVKISGKTVRFSNIFPPCPNVLVSTFLPDPPVAGQVTTITFNAPVSNVQLTLNGEPLEVSGSGTTWSFIATESGQLVVQAEADGYLPYSESVEVEGSSEVAPSIISAVITGNSTVGSVLTATVVATGNPNPTVSIQWLVNGSAVSGATNQTFDTSGLDVGDVVTFSAVASNGVTPNASATSENSITVEEDQDLQLQLSTNSLVGGEGYLGRVEGLTKYQAENWDFRHTIVGLTEERFDYVPESLPRQDASNRKYFATGFMAAFAGLPAGTHTHRVEIYKSPLSTEPDEVLEEQITVLALEEFFAPEDIFYFDATQTDSTIPWDDVPTTVPAARKLRTVAQWNAVVSGENATRKRLLRIIDASGLDIGSNPRLVGGGLYFQGWGNKTREVNAFIGGGTAGAGPWTAYGAIMDGIKIKGTTNTETGDFMLTASHGHGPVSLTDHYNIKQGTVVNCEITNGYMLQGDMSGIPTGPVKPFVVFNTLITDWANFGIWAENQFGFYCGCKITQNPLACNGVEGKSMQPTNNYPDHGGIRLASPAKVITYGCHIFNNCGWSQDNPSYVGHVLMATQATLRIGSTLNSVCEYVGQNNILEGGVSLGTSLPLVSTDTSAWFAVGDFRCNILVAPITMGGGFSFSNPGISAQELLVIYPKAQRVSGNPTRLFADEGAYVPGVGKNPDRYAFPSTIRNITVLDRRDDTQLENASIPTTIEMGAASLHPSTPAEYLSQLSTSDILLLVPDYELADTGEPNVPYNYSLEVLPVEAMNRGLRHFYTVNTLNDTFDERPETAYPTGSIAIPVPTNPSAFTDGTPGGSVVDLRGALKGTATPVGCIAVS